MAYEGLSECNKRTNAFRFVVCNCYCEKLLFSQIERERERENEFFRLSQTQNKHIALFNKLCYTYKTTYLQCYSYYINLLNIRIMFHIS